MKNTHSGHTFYDIVMHFQSLEKRLAEILRLAYNQCPTVESQLRLLEVFEGVSSRDLVQVRIFSQINSEKGLSVLF